MFSQFFVATFLAISTQTVFAVSCSRSYTVQVGDYCDKISQAQNVSTYQLSVMNQNSVDSSCRNLVPGQALCLAEKPEEDCSVTYAVRSGDTCSDIASRSGLNTTILYLNNPQINEGCTNIYTGEVLCISQTVRVPPIPAAGVSVVAPSTTIFVAPTAPASTTPVATAKAAAPPVAPTKAAAPPAAAAAVDNSPADDDEDCEDDSSPSNSANHSSPSSSADDGDDDEDLPFCDEL